MTDPIAVYISELRCAYITSYSRAIYMSESPTGVTYSVSIVIMTRFMLTNIKVSTIYKRSVADGFHRFFTILSFLQ